MTDFPECVAELSERARREREAFEPPPDPPDEEAALEYLTDGVGKVVALYIEARTGEPFRFDDAEFAPARAAARPGRGRRTRPRSGRAVRPRAH